MENTISKVEELNKIDKDANEPNTKKLDDETLIEIRKERILSLLNKRKKFIIYFLLALVVYVAIFIRVRNISGLKDITTGGWTLGPDLDPFLFLRWAEFIVDNGKLMAVDMMRNVPLGYVTSGETRLLSYLIAWMHKIAPFFTQEPSVTYTAIIFPVVMFGFTSIAFFFLTKRIFYDYFDNKNYPNIIAIISTFFLGVIPALLPRTIAGIPEKESAGFLFIFLAFYFFISSYKAKKNKQLCINGILAGVSTAALGLIWGGITFVFMTIGISMFISFIMGSIDRKKFIAYSVWIISSVPIMMFLSTRYFDPSRPLGSIISFVSSTSTIPILATWFLIAFNIFIYPKIEEISTIKKLKIRFRLPKEFLSLVIVLIVLLIISIFTNGLNFFSEQTRDIISQLIHPFATDRFSLTVAENRQPYFGEWKDAFGPLVKNIPLFFWLFIFGSVSLFYSLVKNLNKKERGLITLSYFIFLILLIFSRNSPSSVFNGENTQSILAYFFGIILFIGYSSYIWYKYQKNGQEEKIKINLELILLFVFFLVTILAARGGVRLIMMLVPPTSIMVAYLSVINFKYANDSKENFFKLFLFFIAVIIAIVVIFTGYTFYEVSKGQAIGFVPSSYTQQWQKAMAWVRENTPENSVFGHWWDYGYWVQSLGKRATVLDGGNAIVYWNHLMGRKVLTAPDDKEGLEYLYAHNTTHFLIDSSDIGKYSAYASIGSGVELDRFSFIVPFFINPQETQETVNETIINAYSGSIGLDEDVTYETNENKKIFIQGLTGIVRIYIEESSEGELMQPNALFVEQGGGQTLVPMRFLYYNSKLIDFRSGIDAGFFIIPTISQGNGGINIDKKGSGFYLSRRTVHSFLTRKYLFGEEENFKIVHKEHHFIIQELNSQGANLGDFAYFQGNFLGPIKIWKIEYPTDTRLNESYLDIEYPDLRLRWGS